MGTNYCTVRHCMETHLEKKIGMNKYVISKQSANVLLHFCKVGWLYILSYFNRIEIIIKSNQRLPYAWFILLTPSHGITCCGADLESSSHLISDAAIHRHTRFTLMSMVSMVVLDYAGCWHVITCYSVWRCQKYKPCFIHINYVGQLVKLLLEWNCDQLHFSTLILLSKCAALTGIRSNCGTSGKLLK